VTAPILVDRAIYRGPRPEGLSILRRDYHIDTIIDLELGVYELAFNREAMEYPADFGMAYYHMPCSDWFPPRSQFVWKCLRLMEQDRVIYLHCLSGVDRTGFVVAAYRMVVQGWLLEAAVKEWKELGRHSWFFWWESELKKYEKFRGKGV
jgi:protein-tyrosine phosphatase